MKDASQVLGQIVSWVTWGIGLGLLALIALAVLQVYGFTPLRIRLDPYQFMLLCAAWWLYRGGKL
jgi:hypothetical protein